MSSKLQWALTTKRFGYHIYELGKDNLRLLSLAFDPSTKTARVDYAEIKRSFQIEKKGIFRKRIILKNEYGVKIGELSYEKADSQEGYIDMNEERYFYAIRENNNQEELVIYKSTIDEPLVSCNLSSERNFAGNHKKNLADVYSHLLMALGWFLFLPVPQEKTVYSL